MGDTDALTPAAVSAVPRVLINGVAIEVRRLMLAPAEGRACAARRGG
jgi:hypothetical protein